MTEVILGSTGTNASAATKAQTNTAQQYLIVNDTNAAVHLVVTSSGAATGMSLGDVPSDGWGFDPDFTFPSSVAASGVVFRGTIHAHSHFHFQATGTSSGTFSVAAGAARAKHGTPAVDNQRVYIVNGNTA